MLPSSGCFSEPGEALVEATEGSGGPSEGSTTGSGDSDSGGTTAVTSDGESDAESTGFGETLLGSSTGWGTTGWATGGSGESSEGSGGGSGEESGEVGSTGGGAVCGNGVPEGDEVCDDGPRPALEAGACRPGCDGIIPTRELRLSVTSTAGDLSPNPVASMDALCPAGRRALFAYGDTRRATVFGNEINDPIDWVLHPYTAYVNASGDTIWVTDATPILGVREGVLQPLEHAIVPYEDNPPAALTGMNADWTTSSGTDDDCQGWTSADGLDLHTSGVPWILSDGAFLNNGGFGACDQPSRAYCVQQ